MDAAAAVQQRRDTWEGVVTVGEETARKLTRLLGRPVLAGEEFDLGVICDQVDGRQLDVAQTEAARWFGLIGQEA